MEVLVTEKMDSQIQYPFSVVPAALPASEEESLIDVPTSGSMKIELIQKSLLDFSIGGLCTVYPAQASRAIKA